MKNVRMDLLYDMICSIEMYFDISTIMFTIEAGLNNLVPWYTYWLCNEIKIFVIK